MLFGTFDIAHKNLETNNLLVSSPLLRMSIAGSCAGIVNSVVASPVELLKISSQRGTSFFETFRTIKSSVFSKGFAETAIRDGIYYIFYFPLYHFCKENNVPFAGGIAGVVPWIIIFPIDVIKTLRQAPGATAPPSVTSFYKEHGIQGFYRGLTPTIMRAFPIHYVTWKIYDFLTITL